MADPIESIDASPQGPDIRGQVVDGIVTKNTSERAIPEAERADAQALAHEILDVMDVIVGQSIGDLRTRVRAFVDLVIEKTGGKESHFRAPADDIQKFVAAYDQIDPVELAERCILEGMAYERRKVWTEVAAVMRNYWSSFEGMTHYAEEKSRGPERTQEGDRDASAGDEARQ